MSVGAGVPKMSAEEIAKKVRELTKGSAFDVRKEEKRRSLEVRVTEMNKKLSSLTDAERGRARSVVDKAIADAEFGRILSKVMVHIDMDAFYASVEIRDQPELADKAIAVGSNSMLSTCNYIARSYGARSGMPGFVAKKLCPDLIILPHNFKKYQAVAHQVRDIFSEYCPDFLSGGLDEAYLDLTEYLEARLTDQTSNQIIDFQVPETITSRTGCKCSNENQSTDTPSQVEAPAESPLYCATCKLLKCNVGDKISFGNSVWSVVEEIRFKILLKTLLTSSAGIAPNTMIAKIASDLNKPNGQYMLKSTASAVLKLMSTMPVAKVPGIGPVSQGELQGLGIVTCGDLKDRLYDVYLLHSELHFSFLLHVALGIGSTELEHGGPRKSIGTETTFDKTSDAIRLLEIIHDLCVEVADSLQEEQLCGRTLTLKLKTADFKVLTRAGSSKGYFMPANKGEDLYQVGKSLLDKEFAENGGRLCIRLLGVRVSNLKDLQGQSESSAVASSEANITALLNKKRKEPDDLSSTRKRISDYDDDNDKDLILLENEPASTSPSTSIGIGGSDDNSIVSYKCPICHFTFPRTTLAKFNNHIDECLNRSAIRTLKEEEKLLSVVTNEAARDRKAQISTKGSKDKSSSSNTKVGKKSPSKSTQNTILAFLKPRQ